MKKFLFFAVATAMLGLTFTSCDDEKEESEKTALEGKWVHSERDEYDNNGYADRVESFTFKGNTYILECSETGRNPQGELWGYGHKLTGTFTCTGSTFTIKVEKFYGFNNGDVQFDWHEYDDGTEGKSFTFSYQIEDGHSLGVTAPDEFALGAGSYLGADQAWYAKE